MNNLISWFSKLNIYLGVFLILSAPAYLFLSAELRPVVVTSNSLPATPTERENEILTNNLAIKGVLSGSRNTMKAVKVADDAHIRINSIGLDAKIYEGADFKTLEQGIWRMPMHATPDDQVSGQPVVLAGHRWGEDNFTYEYRSKNLFLNIPTLNKGDIIEITWNGQIYKYKVEYLSKDIYVDRLSDLILITCVDYVSTTRYFVFAERV